MSSNSVNEKSNVLARYSRELLYFLLMILFSSFKDFAQNDDYWVNAQSGSIRIFTIYFSDKQNGKAESAEGEIFITTDAGKTWLQKELTSFRQKHSNQIFWEADIYCSIMKTTDGGNTWISYDEGKQQHFCGVYLKDENSGYKIANDFLNKVTEKVSEYSKEGNIDELINQPQKCTEYYRNADEGWAVGWCLKNFLINNK